MKIVKGNVRLLHVTFVYDSAVFYAIYYYSLLNNKLISV